MIMPRDEKVIEFLSEKNHKVAHTTTLSELFYSGNIRVTQRRLKILCEEHNVIDKRRDPWSFEALFCAKGRKISQLKHSLLYTDFLKAMVKNKAKIIESIAEYSIGELRSDGVVFYEYKGKKYIAFIEVQTSECHTQANVQKYLDLYYSNECQNKWNTFPKLIVITNKRKTQQVDEFDVIEIREDFSNIDKLFDS